MCVSLGHRLPSRQCITLHPPYVPTSPVPIEVERPSASSAIPPVPRIPRSQPQPLLRRLLADVKAFQPHLEEARKVYRRHHLETQREQDNRRRKISIDEPVSRRIQKTIRHQARRRSHHRRQANEVVFCKPCDKVLPSERHYESHKGTTAHKNKAKFSPKTCKSFHNQQFFSEQDWVRHQNGRRHRANLSK